MHGMVASPTNSPGNKKAQLTALRAELGPGYSPQRIWAALRCLGLEPEDVDPTTAAGQNVTVTPALSGVAAETLREKRKGVLRSLRDSRIAELRLKLDSLTEEEVHHYERCTGKGLSPVKISDVPAAQHVVAGNVYTGETAEEAEKREKREEERITVVKRKADKVAMNFLQEQKRQAEAEQKFIDLEKRLKESLKMKTDEIKAKQAAYKKKVEARQQLLERRAQEREEHADECELSMSQKMVEAAKHRAVEQAWENRKEKLASPFRKKAPDQGGGACTLEDWTKMVHERREDIYRRACEKEEDMIVTIEERDAAHRERMEDARRLQEEEMEIRREELASKYQQRQLNVMTANMQFAETVLDRHKKFEQKLNEAQKNGSKIVKERSKSCGDVRKKATEKWKSNSDRLNESRMGFVDNLEERHARAARNREATMALGLKSGIDIHTFRETRHKTFGDLQKKRLAEWQRAQDAHQQKTLFQIAGATAMNCARELAQRDVDKRRQALHKDALTKNDAAQVAFIKMRSLSDERKIVDTMNSLGFDMPRLEEEDDEPIDEKKAAF